MANNEDKVIMRFILTEQQADAQFTCLLDRMAEILHDSSILRGESAEGEGPAAVVPKIEGFSAEEMSFADSLRRTLISSKRRGIRIGPALVALHRTRAASN